MKTKYFDLAKQIAQKSPSRFKLGAVITKQNKVLGVGWNDMLKTHPKMNTYDNRYHAELHALIGLDIKHTKGATIYVYRERKDGSMGNAKPCNVCETALKLAKIKSVCYSHEDGYKEERIK